MLNIDEYIRESYNEYRDWYTILEFAKLQPVKTPNKPNLEILKIVIEAFKLKEENINIIRMNEELQLKLLETGARPGWFRDEAYEEMDIPKSSKIKSFPFGRNEKTYYGFKTYPYGSIYYSKDLANKEDIKLLKKEGYVESDEKVNEALGRILGYSYPNFTAKTYFDLSYEAKNKSRTFQIFAERVPLDYNIKKIRDKLEKIKYSLPNYKVILKETFFDFN